MNEMLAEAASGKAAARPDRRRLAMLWMATAGAVVVHNAEEQLFGLTGWIADHPWLPGRGLHGDAAQFGLVLAIVTAAVLAIAITAVVARPLWSAEVLTCVAYALMVNGASHALLSLLSWSVMPGALSGVAVLLPLGAFIIRALPPVRWTVSTVIATVVAAVGITAGAFVLASVLMGFE